MTALHVAALLGVALTGAATVLMRDPLRPIVTSGVFGLALAVLFFVFAAPDVALSELVVATVALPAMALLTLARMTREDDEE